MHSIKPGRGPSALGAFAGIFAVIFGLLWTVLAFALTRSFPIPVVGIVFPLFGVAFVIMGIVNVLYNLRNATAKERYSVIDITTGAEEPDPLNRLVHPTADGESVEAKLRKLDDLKSKGLISLAEHTAQRTRILNSI
ncbi:MAG: SHOCT domain-containing protein [Terrimicrobiaceae bacterium]